ncbi:hypothetical protein PCANC_14105 [Puccinia coronata f. sp. avenae]|uniref:Uncharacterized protein n=1 Tax=Puccinia coronata f. sp. avenae TaxID=200324 RepID=A0A2N5VRU4_9BASI|nr:hypothetical protein PCANC_14105 [Puccinia coronata f. sp. avenae]
MVPGPTFSQRALSSLLRRVRSAMSRYNRNSQQLRPPSNRSNSVTATPTSSSAARCRRHTSTITMGRVAFCPDNNMEAVIITKFPSSIPLNVGRMSDPCASRYDDTDYTMFLNLLLTGIDDQSKAFQWNIRRYNNAVSFASCGALIDHSTQGYHDPQFDQRVYNAPRTLEVGFVIHNDSPEEILLRHICLQGKGRGFYHATDDFSGYLPL